MKRTLLTLLAVCALIATSCEDYKAQIEDTQKKIDALQENLKVLETVTANLGALRNVCLIAQAADPIVSVTPKDQGYTFAFKNNGEVTVMPQTAGVSIGEANGEYFWTLNGEAMKDVWGKTATIDVTPKFRVEEDKIQVSTDGGTSWTDVSKDAQAVIARVEEFATGIAVTFLGGTVVNLPKESFITVSLSGDGSTLAASGPAVVDFLINGETGSYSVVPVLAEGWTAKVVWENSFKGTVTFTAPQGAEPAARVIFCDGYGRSVTSDIDFTKLTVDEAFPVM